MYFAYNVVRVTKYVSEALATMQKEGQTVRKWQHDVNYSLGVTLGMSMSGVLHSNRLQENRDF
jgi:hypothetical protein